MIDVVNEVGALAQAFPIALQNFLPNLHPFDLMVGIAFGIGMKVVVYVRGKNAKKYCHGA